MRQVFEVIQFEGEFVDDNVAVVVRLETPFDLQLLQTIHEVQHVTDVLPLVTWLCLEHDT